MIAHHPISLEHTYFTKVFVEAIPTFQQAAEGAPASHIPENNLEIRVLTESPKRFMAIMTTKFNLNKESTSPYSIEMQCVGVFSADDTIEMPEAMRGVNITAHSVLYGAIRECISWITGRQPHGHLQIGLSILQTKPKPKEPKE